MIRLHALLVVLSLSLPSFAATGGASVAINHSGYVLGPTDQPIEQLSQAFTFRLYDRADVTGQQLQWTATCSTDVRAGFYAVTLGVAPCAGDGLDTADLPAGEARWLEVTIGTVALTPRLRVDASPKATLADDAMKFSGHPLTDFWLRADAVDAATLGNQSLSQLDSRYVKPIANGNVGIGVPTPTAKLAVAGTIQSTTGGFVFPDATTQATAGLTSLTGSAPISISAGSTPTVSIATAGTSSAGALTSSDWNSFNGRVLRSGDTMSGALNLGTNRITNLGDPASAQDAATRTYVDTKVLNGPYTLPVATTTTPGAVKAGSGLSVAGDGTLSVSSAFGSVPIGTIMAWHKNLANTPALPSGWAECNGQTVSDAESVYNGVALPNLNGEARFLRGGATSGAMQNGTRVAVTVETNAGALFFDASGRNMTAYNNDYDAVDTLGTSQRGSIARTGIDNAPGQVYAGKPRPINMSVVWIIRIK